ncbi:hypothetical protein [Streptomyces sp. NPDC002763]|uniref:hypothetical protein n=1 Tax=Streptomyces sp. NPDC002763 TaxID=3154427 RepID=UPI00331E5BCB
MSTKLQQIMLAAAEDPTTLSELRDDPQALADRFGLSCDAYQRLADAERLIPAWRGEYSTITLHTITITGGIGR